MRTCPKYKTTDYDNRYFTLMINECGHSLCKNCVDALFVRQSGPCPICGRNLKKSSYWEQIFDDPLIEKQTFYRKKLQKIFNLKQDDFPTLRDFNNYLENFETCVNNLTFDTDLERTWKTIEAFQAEHEDLILKNKNRPSKDEEWIQKQLDDERKAKEDAGHYMGLNRDSDLTDELDCSKKRHEQDAKELIAELMSSDADVSQIISRKRYEALKLKEEQDLKRAALATKRAAESIQASKLARRQLHSNRSNRHDQEIVPLDQAAQTGQPYVYVEIKFEDWSGPAPPEIEQEILASQGYLKHIKPAAGWQLAGGYFEALGCARALTEARCDLFW